MQEELPQALRIDELSRVAATAPVVIAAEDRTFARSCYRWSGGEVLRDTFGDGLSAWISVRLSAKVNAEVALNIPGTHELRRCEGGGWLLTARDAPVRYWMPQRPTLRTVDADGHILWEKPAPIQSVSTEAGQTRVTLSADEGEWLDFGYWELAPDDARTASFLTSRHCAVDPPVFLWGSHTTVRRPADFYRHFVHGRIYEDRYQWPKHWRIYSENDAHALYVTLSGLFRQQEAGLYDRMRRQMVFSTIWRQGADGAWRHGEWTDSMECHCRLHCSAMHMLMDYLCERNDKVVLESLKKAAAFVHGIRDETDVGAWFLHDELETGEDRMRDSPFKWIHSRAFGKSPANMLVLNTTLDTSIALQRYAEIAEDDQYQNTVASAGRAICAVLGAAPANWVYGPLWFAIRLTLLPTPRAAALPLPMRAIKRLGWKYLIGLLPKVKAHWPRLVMPGGYVDRALTLRGLSDAYLSINAMDMARYLRKWPHPQIQEILEQALAFGDHNGMLEHWGESAKPRYAIGFWMEAYYHLCATEPTASRRNGLANAIRNAWATGLGVAPSLLGGNAESISPGRQSQVPQTGVNGVIVADLTNDTHYAVLVVNCTTSVCHLGAQRWAENEHTKAIAWTDSAGRPCRIPGDCHLPPGDWVWGTSDRAS